MKSITAIYVPERLTEQPLRVAAYARVSTDSDEQLVSLDAQKTYYEKLIRSNPKWEYAGLYYDEERSYPALLKSGETSLYACPAQTSSSPECPNKPTLMTMLPASVSRFCTSM